LASIAKQPIMIQSAMLISITIAIADSPFLLALETQSVAEAIICLKFSAKALGNVRLCIAPTPAHLQQDLSLVGTSSVSQIADG
jgi:hypothetical protein